MTISKKRIKAIAHAIIDLRDTITDEQALKVAVLYPTWAVNITYKTGDRVIYNDIMYKVLAEHTSQEDWTPDVAVSLFTKILIPDNNTIYPWEQPDSTNPYSSSKTTLSLSG